MALLTLDIIPGYTDLSNTALVANNPAFGIHVEAISANAAFGKVRTEIFHSLHFHGDTVPTPVSPIDKYVYSRDECIYFYNIAVSTNKDSGWIQIGSGSLWFTNWFVDQSTGQVTSLEWYRNGGSGGARTETNDGQIIVYTIAHRQRTTLLMSGIPTLSAISDADCGIDKPWTQALAQGLNGNAKFSVNNHEIFYCGEYTDGTVIPLSKVISEDDGYTYGYSECRFLGFWRWTTIGSALTQPPENAAFLGPFAWAIDPDGTVHMYMERISNDGDDNIAAGYGRMSVMAFCTRAATPTTEGTLANGFAEVDEGSFVPGSTLRASSVLQIKKNIDEAILTPEFFGVYEYANGDTVSTPVSPVDGYAYSRDELTYVWAWNAIRPNIGGNVRLPIFYGGVNQTTGQVSLTTWRLTSHYIDDDNSLSRIKMVIVARRNGHPKSTLTVTPTPPSDWPTNEVVQPYSINYDMGGARTTPPEAGEVLLVHVIPTLPTGLDKIKFSADLLGSTAGARTSCSYVIDIKLNGGTIGQLSYSGTTGTYSFSADILATPGQTLTFTLASGTPDPVPDPPVVIGLFWTMIGNRY
jgi:hypothetical protein